MKNIHLSPVYTGDSSRAALSLFVFSTSRPSRESKSRRITSAHQIFIFLVVILVVVVVEAERIHDSISDAQTHTTREGRREQQ